MRGSGDHGSVSDLLDRAQLWVAEVQPHPRHLERTLHWLLELDPTASEALRIAAVVHDIERAFPAPDSPFDPAADPAAREYNDWHQRRCAEITREWLREQHAPEALTEQVTALVGVHEWGGWPEADLLQAADSLSFLEVQIGMFADRVASGVLTLEVAEAKLRFMQERIRVPRARELGAPMLAAGLARLAAQATAKTN